ncbi:MAG TPA: hypothetical protein VKQ71_02775 [Acidimicrobiales bacterium]|nr:hypothetical protein [Acidimicrobiales bacterium]
MTDRQAESDPQDLKTPVPGDVISPSLEQPPLKIRRAAAAVLRSVWTTGLLLAQRRIHQPREHLGETLHFADGTSAPVYRETMVQRHRTESPVVLVVEFRLRWVHGRRHALFRAESLLNTPLFVGSSGFVSKLWLAHDQNDVYRGVYEWDDPTLAHTYARALWRVLALVSVPGSIHYVVLPGLHRDALLANPGVTDPGGRIGEWWRLVNVERATA